MRRWGLDALRGAMMLLGVGYHAAWAYVPDIGRWYVVQDVSSSAVFVTLTGLLHAFRMQTFFLLAGLFSRLSFEHRGAAFLKERAKRLLLPFALAWPVMMVADVAVRRAAVLSPDYALGTHWSLRPQHLWFLLATFGWCAALVAVERVVGTAFASRVLVVLARGRALLALSVLTLGAAWLADARPDWSVLPDASSLLAYGPFFAVGWALWPVRDEVSGLLRWSWLWLVLGLCAGAWLFSGSLQWALTGRVLGGVVGWACVLGLVGLGLRSGEGRETPPWFWLVDSAYWVYLIHYPIVVVMHLLLRDLAWPVGVKFGVVIVSVLSLTLASWRFVRPTALGALLGAKRAT